MNTLFIKLVKFISIAVSALVFIYLITIAKFDIVSQGEGVLAIIDSNINISSPTSGIIRKIYVTTGDKVDVGTQLMTISNIEDENKRILLKSSSTLIFQQIETLSAELKALKMSFDEGIPVINEKVKDSTKLLKIKNKYKIYTQKKTEFEDKKKHVKNKISNLSNQESLLKEKTEMIRSSLGNTVRFLDSKLEVEKIQLQIVESQLEIDLSKSAADVAYIDFIQLILELMEQLEADIKKNKEQLSATNAELNTVNERIESTDIISTAKGTVLSLRDGLSEEIYIERGTEIMTLKRDNDGVFVDAKFDSKYRPYLDLDIPVKIKINAPGIKDYFYGKITKISVDSFEKEGHGNKEERYYNVKVSLNKDSNPVKTEKLGELLGIKTAVYVINDKISFIEYILSTFNKDLDFTVW